MLLVPGFESRTVHPVALVGYTSVVRSAVTLMCLIAK
jgi:hypothetical protein